LNTGVLVAVFSALLWFVIRVDRPLVVPGEAESDAFPATDAPAQPSPA